ncbi:MAG: GH92 family glycosyl hydrolase [Bacteroidia bacterium]
MRKKVFYALLGIVLWMALQPVFSQSNWVNPFVGTDGHGHTFPGAVWPFGMVQVSPDTRIDGSWDGCSGYHYSDSLLYGFSHTHLSGTGVSDYGDFLLMPMAGTWSMDPSKYRTAFRHDDERARPGHYTVRLANGIEVDLVAGQRTGLHTLRYPAGQEAYLLLDLLHRDSLIEGRIEQVDPYRWKIYRRSRAWATDQHAYAFVEFSEPAIVVKDSASRQVLWSFPDRRTESPGAKEKLVMVKVGFSHVDAEGAAQNLRTEIPSWDRKELLNSVTRAWDQALGVVDVQDQDSSKIRTFYTALYHCFIHPSLASDVDGRYRGRDGQIHVAKDFQYYTVFSLWDTYRALHPLLTLVDSVRTRDFLMTFVAQFEQAGRLPVWELSSNETNCMIGYHSVSVMADALTKGYKDFDVAKAWEAMVHSANQDYEGIAWLRDHGHLSVEACSESVSKNVEYAYDDWCIAQVAKVRGDTVAYRNYLQRSGSWRNLLDSLSGMMRPRQNGQWLTPFDPREVNNHYTEANAWQTSFYIPQDVYGWMEAVGGADRAEALLDTLFATSSKTTGRTQADITGLIGQYAHGNEPSHHIAYLYHYLGRPQKTLNLVRQIQNNFYTNQPDGLVGNEDCGQMSAWYVLSMLGFYPVTPGSTEWIWSVPSLNSYRIRLPNGRFLTVQTDSNCTQGIAWPERRVNGHLNDALALEHTKLLEGGTWTYTSRGSRPPSYTFPKRLDAPIAGGSVPLIEANSRIFGDSLRVTVRVQGKDQSLKVATGGADPRTAGIPYTGPFWIHRSDTVSAVVMESGGRPGWVSTAIYRQVDPRLRMEVTHAPNPQYTAGGLLALVDGVQGEEDWRKGGWHGVQGQPFELVMTLPERTFLRSINVGFLQDVRSWIVFPSKLNIWVREDQSKEWEFWGSTQPRLGVRDWTVTRDDLGVSKNKPIKAGQIKILAEQYGPLPEGHPGVGGQSFLFVDEIRWH